MAGNRIWIWMSLFLLSTTGRAGSVDSLQQVLRLSARDTHRIVLLNALADAFEGVNQDSNYTYLWKAYRLSGDLGWIRGMAEGEYRLGMHYRSVGNAGKAVANLMASVNHFAEIRDWAGRATSLRRLAFLWAGEGRYSEADSLYNLALADARRGQALDVVAKVLSGMAGLYRLQGLYDRAVDAGLQALALQEELDDREGMTYTLDRLGVVFKLKEDYGKALDYYLRALELRRQIPGTGLSDLAYSSMVIGETYMAMDSLEPARQAHQQAMAWYRRSSDASGMAYATYQLGEVARRMHRFSDAGRWLDEARQAFHTQDNARGEVNCLYSLTALMLDQARYGTALRYAKDFNRMADQLGSQNHRMNSRYFLYQIAKNQGRWAEALHFHEAYQMVKDSVWNEDTGGRIANLESGYILRQKDEENLRLSLEADLSQIRSKANRQRTWTLIALLCLFVLGLSSIWRGLRRERVHGRLLAEQNRQISTQRESLVAAEAGLKAMIENLEEIVSVRTEELKRSNDKLERYAYLASHDLKQPLRTISGFAQLLERENQKHDAKNERTEEYIQYITGGIRYMHQLIDNVLKSSRYASGDGNKFSRVVLEDVLTEVKSRLKRQILSSDAVIESDMNGLELVAVKIKIEQLLQNLLANALKFRKPGVPARIHIRATEKDDRIEIQVTDNGIGIRKADQEAIFQMFRRLHSRGESQGAGLGLTLCRKIAEQHGGQIRVDSAEGQGSTFWVTLAKDAEQSENQEAA